MRVEDNDIGWSSSVRNVGKDMERIVGFDAHTRLCRSRRLQGFFRGGGHAPVDFEELDMRDVERMRGSGTRSFEERTYAHRAARARNLLQCGWSLDATSTAACSKKSAPSSKACPWRSCRGGPTPMRMCRLNRLSSTSIWKPCRCWTAKTKALGPRRAGCWVWRRECARMAIHAGHDAAHLSLVEAQERAFRRWSAAIRPRPSTHVTWRHVVESKPSFAVQRSGVGVLATAGFF